ncbi:AhpC/TSA family protein [Marinomonas agarivorans]|nr:AhpC/TSA family protein [Marinomonas agarivorans]
MTTSVLQPGQDFQPLTVSKLGGGSLTLGKPAEGFEWQLIVVYRGKHCPICTRYLGEFNDALAEFNKAGVEVVAVSADSEARATAQIAEVNPDFSVGYDLSIEQMQQLGLFISGPRLGMDAERPFAEPGLFVINGEGKLQIIDISNVPFARPSVRSLVMGINFLRSRAEAFPINGTYSA